MGYRSDFTLTWQGECNPLARLEEISGYRWWKEGSDALTILEAKWYNSESDMQQLSESFPDIKFEVSAQGEDGEQWIIDAYQGEIDVRHASREFPPRTLYDPETPKHLEVHKP